jgi:small acid-soluble spore protein (thioredoxin-like protein)
MSEFVKGFKEYFFVQVKKYEKRFLMIPAHRQMLHLQVFAGPAKEGEWNMTKSIRPKPDDRRDNVDKIQYNINKTIQNMELADEVIHKSDDEKLKRDLKEKNKRREDALEGMRDEIRDEARARKKGNR